MFVITKDSHTQTLWLSSITKLDKFYQFAFLCKNSFAFNGEYKDMEYTKKVIKKCHEMWYNFFHKENEIPII